MSRAVRSLVIATLWADLACAAPVAHAIESGEQLYTRCAACHSPDYDRTGPHHCGLFGRKAGSVPGFDYSDAMRKSGIVWNERTLDRFLRDPMKAVPGTAMTYAGVTDDEERKVLIAYLKSLDQTPACAQMRAR